MPQILSVQKLFLKESLNHAKQTLELVKTPGVKTINDVCSLLKIKPTNSIKNANC